MNVGYFIDSCREILPPAKDLTSAQWTAYRGKLGVFDERQLQRLLDAVIENCKRFPTIADVYEQARNLGFTNRKEKPPHTWTPTDCQVCGGSGMVAAFWAQEFDLTDGIKTQVLRLHYVYPYRQSAEYAGRREHNDIRAVYRCFCDRGDVETLDRGIPRWRVDMPETMRRAWTR